MQALVTGGTGFIGSHLVDELLGQGYNIRVLRRATSTLGFLEGKKVEFSIGDLREKESLLRACHQIDIVFHIAALPRDWGRRKTFFQTNYEGTKNLLEACVKNKVPRFIFMSSAAVYGFPKTQKPITEDSQKNPTAKYGESKLCAEELLWWYGKNHNLTVSAIRSPLVTGPRDRLIALFLIKALQQKRLFYVGNGNQKISVSDVRDIAYSLRLAGESNKANGQVYNVKSFDSTPRELIENLAKQLHVPAPKAQRSYLGAYVLASVIEGIWFLRRKENPPFTRQKVRMLGKTRLFDITKAKKELLYSPRYTCATTIDDVISWYGTVDKGISGKA